MVTSVAVALPRLSAHAESVFGVAQLRQFLTTSLGDAALAGYLSAAFEAIDDVLGPLVVTERRRPHGELLMLSEDAASITTVVENALWSPLTLADDDYQLSSTGRQLLRLRTGTNPSWRWCGRVDVTYIRQEDVARRIRAAVALVQLELGFLPGLASRTIGTYSETFASGRPYAEQRAEILASLVNDVAYVR